MRCPTLKELPAPPNNKTGWPWTAATGAGRLPDDTANGYNLPKISIVTPSFNQGKFIEETIRSVLLQGYPNLEYIVIDGGSTDRSVDIIRKYERWLAFWISEPDRGQSHAINKGFMKATGEIVAWLNSDDIYLENALYLAAAELDRHKNKYIIFGDCCVTDENSKIIKVWKANYSNRNELIKYWSEKNAIFQPATFFYKELLDKFGLLNENLHYCMDYELWLRFSSAYEFHYLNKVLATYRFHPSSKMVTMPEPAYNEWIRMTERYWGDNFSFSYLSNWLSSQSDKWYLTAMKYHRLGYNLLSWRAFLVSILIFPLNLLYRRYFSLLLRISIGDKLADKGKAFLAKIIH